MPIIERRLQRKRYLIRGVIAAASLGIAFVGYQFYMTEPVARSEKAAPFDLRDMDGKPFQLSTLAGKPVAIFFGFTQCPDVCPTTLHRLALMREKIGAPMDDLQILFVSLDPERDTPEKLKSYFSSQPIKVIGLTGNKDEVASAARQFDVYYEFVHHSPQDYTIDHTASLFLIDRKGRRVGEIAFDADESEFGRKLRSLL